jgi:hypothetical protein
VPAAVQSKRSRSIFSSSHFCHNLHLGQDGIWATVDSETSCKWQGQPSIGRRFASQMIVISIYVIDSLAQSDNPAWPSQYLKLITGGAFKKQCSPHSRHVNVQGNLAIWNRRGGKRKRRHLLKWAIVGFKFLTLKIPRTNASSSRGSSTGNLPTRARSNRNGTIYFHSHWNPYDGRHQEMRHARYHLRER